jgi:GGDEF domain-containing protein/EAL domain-containing protein (putative c-di-GMP-specific phosphodiesterase class I)/tetratricopeptide (TPR) repeat protein
MTLKDILDLPTEADSLESIRTYLGQTLKQTEYQAAFARYFEIASALGLHDLVLEEGERILPDVTNQSPTPYLERIIGVMVTSALEQDAHDKAKTLIDMRKDVLPVRKSYLATLDMIRYNRALNLPLEELYMQVLGDEIPDEIRTRSLWELAQIHMENGRFEDALECVRNLRSYDTGADLDAFEITCLSHLDKDDEVRDLARKALNTTGFNRVAVNALLRIHMKNGETQKAQALDAEYELLMEEAGSDSRLEFYEMLADLYRRTGNKLSLGVYQKKLKSLNKAIERPSKGEVQPKEKPVVVVSAPQPSARKHHHLAEQFERANDLLSFERTISKKALFRDYLRELLIRLSASLPVLDVIIWLDDASPNFFNYKKERLYDKTVVREWIEGTVIERVMASKAAIQSKMVTIRDRKNPVTQKPYDEDITDVYAFPLDDRGVMVVLTQEPGEESGSYHDLFRVLSNIIATRLSFESDTARLKDRIRYFDALIHSPALAYRDMTETMSTYNDKARAMLSVEAHTHFEVFMRDVAHAHVKTIQDTVARLFQRPGQQATITYERQNRTIEESLVSLRMEDGIHVTSLFHDRTDDSARVKELIQMATEDDETGLLNTHALSENIQDHLEDKATLFLIGFDRSSKHIYGSARMTRFFKEFAQVTKKFFNDGTVYRTDFSELLAFIPQNDIRTVTKRIRSYLRHIGAHQSSVLAFEQFRCHVGVLRHPVATSDTRLEKLMGYLDIALERAKRSKDEPYVFFVYKDYEDEVFEQQVIDQLNMAIETKRVGLSFRQITDIENNRVWHYESALVLENLEVESAYLDMIAAARHRTKDLERFHIDRVLSYLHTLGQETGKLVRLTVPVSKETFLDPQFNGYVIDRLKTYAIPADFIRLKIDAVLKSSHHANQIDELVSYGISLDTTSLETALAYPVAALHVPFPREDVRHIEYLKTLRSIFDGFGVDFVVRNVMTRDQKETVRKLGVKLIEGPLYKRISEKTLKDKVKGAGSDA